MLWLLSALAADRFICNGPASSARLQIAIALVFSLLTCRGVLLVVETIGLKASGDAWRDWPYYVPITVFALFWGRHNFLDFLYYDEFSRFEMLALPPSKILRDLFVPVNDHLMPIAKLYWYVIYSVFRSNYIGVATGALVCTVVFLVSVFALIRVAAPGDPRRLPLVLTTLLAATPHSPHIILWKGAGDSVLLTMTFFFPTLLLLIHVIEGRLPPSLRAFTLVLAGTFLTLFTSSLVTILPVYLVPLGLWLYLQPGPKRQRVGFFLAAFAAAVAATLLYWFLRRYVAKIDLPHTEWRWKNYLGSLRGALELYFHARILLGLFLAGSALLGGLLLLVLFRQGLRIGWSESLRVEPAALVWALGFLMFAVGTLQLTAARRMTYESRREMAGYHLFLPNWGLGLASAGLVSVAAHHLARLATRRTRLVRWPTVPVLARGVVYASVAGYCVWQGGRLSHDWPILTAFPLQYGVYSYPAPVPAGQTRITVIRDRAQFAADLRRFLQAAARTVPHGEQNEILLPDLALAESPRFGALALWPIYLNTHPQFSADWIAKSRLSFQARVVRLDSWLWKHREIHFLPPEAMPPQTLQLLLTNPDTGTFLHRYWPDLRPASTS
jgi:hypothetical protein